MISQAIAKIRAEIDKTTDPMQKMLGQQIIDNITSNKMAMLVLAEDKTLPGCKRMFDDYASSHKSGSQAVIGPKQAEELIFDYFGLNINEAPASHRDNPGVINILDLI